MSPRRLQVQLGLTLLSFVVPAVWTSCNRLIHPQPVVSAPISPALAGTGALACPVGGGLDDAGDNLVPQASSLAGTAASDGEVCRVRDMVEELRQLQADQ
jgi:hypothetical protein